MSSSSEVRAILQGNPSPNHEVWIVKAPKIVSVLWGLPFKTSAKSSDFLTPSPPSPQINTTSLTKVAYYVCFWRYPSPLSADVINGSPLRVITATLLRRPSTVTVSGRACTNQPLKEILWSQEAHFGLARSVVFRLQGREGKSSRFGRPPPSIWERERERERGWAAGRATCLAWPAQEEEFRKRKFLPSFLTFHSRDWNWFLQLRDRTHELHRCAL